MPNEGTTPSSRRENNNVPPNTVDIEEPEEKKSLITRLIIYLKILRKYFVIEPLLVLWLLPSCFFLIAIPNLALEKACRVNLGYNKLICDNVLEKSEDIDCDVFEESSYDKIIENVFNITNNSTDFNYVVCKAELETQKAVTFINGVRGPVSSVFQVIVILYAGNLSDRLGKRKPLMLLPLIGEFLSALALLISSIYFDEIPMEFGAFLEKLLPGLLGGPTLMIMGVYSYLIATTKEEDRVFRLGIFGMCLTIITIVGSPFSGTLYTQLGYVNVFILGAVLLACGILYLFLFVKEVEQTEAKDVKKEKFSCKEGLLVAYDSSKVLIKKRENDGRKYLILLTICYFLLIGPANGEADLLYPYTLIRLNFNGDDFSYFYTFSQAIAACGTFIMTTILSKMLKVTDAMIGLLASICSVIARVCFAFAKEYILYYAGGVFDMFVVARTISLKTIISLFVLPEELGRIYSVLGIADALGTFIFTPMYSSLYNATVANFPGAFYLFSEIFLVPSSFIFFIVYLLLRKRKPPPSDPEGKGENGIDNIAMDDKNPDTMDTHL
ncbi:proton-coupled folate transporter [Condylostylus longicornis]|uniref:proton-coupled folate transporter n=1 Tax=Condylostylus longicornis TaxID=2530218 RepID=UPI00244DDC0A|nr:proton-coupled folate transporter [Condylostylus longicornis]XP_055381795.1 proton-coupled folate transporter [Condylostylus longicornis]